MHKLFLFLTYVIPQNRKGEREGKRQEVWGRVSVGLWNKHTRVWVSVLASTIRIYGENPLPPNNFEKYTIKHNPKVNIVDKHRNSEDGGLQLWIAGNRGWPISSDNFGHPPFPAIQSCKPPSSKSLCLSTMTTKVLRKRNSSKTVPYTKMNITWNPGCRSKQETRRQNDISSLLQSHCQIKWLQKYQGRTVNGKQLFISTDIGDLYFCDHLVKRRLGIKVVVLPFHLCVLFRPVYALFFYLYFIDGENRVESCQKLMSIYVTYLKPRSRTRSSSWFLDELTMSLRSYRWKNDKLRDIQEVIKM